jgi:hypothetical protein
MAQLASYENTLATFWNQPLTGASKSDSSRPERIPFFIGAGEACLIGVSFCIIFAAWRLGAKKGAQPIPARETAAHWL